MRLLPQRLDRIRIRGGHYPLRDHYDVIEVQGRDGQDFLQRQTTADLTKLTPDKAILTCHLDRNGRMLSFFYVYLYEDKLELLVSKDFSQKVGEELEKYIIMDDVTLLESSRNVGLVFGEEVIKTKGFGPLINFNGDTARLVFGQSQQDSPSISTEDLELLRMLNGWPKWNDDLSSKNFITDCRLSEVALSYTKGCFPGQETVSKISNNRGAAFYPTLFIGQGVYNVKSGESVYIESKKVGEILFSLVDEEFSYIGLKLSRAWRVDGLESEIEIGDIKIRGNIQYFPYFSASTLEEKSKELYERGAHKFQENEENEAIELLRLAIKFDPENGEAYESLGVILGRMNQFDEAIELMNQLQIIDPDSVMAHTNKSLYYMKLGKIEEAEQEKANATLKSFEMYGKEAEAKEKKELEKKKKEDEMSSRRAMFEQVLEIDPADEVANYGLADIHFYYGDYDKSIQRLTTLISQSPKYSRAYLLLGKCYEAQSDKANAIEVYREGIKVATSKGELMPANEMQARLTKL